MTAVSDETVLKRNEVLSFDDGLLTIKISGHGAGDGWGSIAFHERQIEIDADGFHVAEIPPSELRALRDFLNRIIPAALSAAPVETWKCAARKQSLPEPADCGWPTCGCDPYADKVIAALEEQGQAAPVAQKPVASDAALLAVCRTMKPNIFARGLLPLDRDGPVTRATIENTKHEARKILDALKPYIVPTATPAGLGENKLRKLRYENRELRERVASQFTNEQYHQAKAASFEEGKLAASADVGADEIKELVRTTIHANYSDRPRLQLAFERAILALLSRGSGSDQQRSQKDGSR